VRVQYLGFDAAGLTHIPVDRDRVSEASCRPLFGLSEPLDVDVKQVTLDVPITCLACAASSQEPFTANAMTYDGKPVHVIGTSTGEYGPRFSFRTESGAIITTTPGLDPRCGS
jgi:hypothetical protein